MTPTATARSILSRHDLLPDDPDRASDVCRAVVASIDAGDSPERVAEVLDYIGLGTAGRLGGVAGELIDAIQGDKQ